MSKHPRRGKPEERCFWLRDVSARQLTYGTSRRQPASKSKAVDLDDVLEVREGWGTQVFRRTSKKQTSATEMCCFSLILKARSLDLSCATPVSARRCVLGFRELTNVDGRTIELDPVPYPPCEGEQIILDLYSQYEPMYVSFTGDRSPRITFPSVALAEAAARSPLRPAPGEVSEEAQMRAAMEDSERAEWRDGEMGPGCLQYQGGGDLTEGRRMIPGVQGGGQGGGQDIDEEEEAFQEALRLSQLEAELGGGGGGGGRGGGGGGGRGGAQHPEGEDWTCGACTMNNTSADQDSCNICGTPRPPPVAAAAAAAAGAGAGAAQENAAGGGGGGGVGGGDEEDDELAAVLRMSEEAHLKEKERRTSIDAERDQVRGGERERERERQRETKRVKESMHD